MKRLLLASAVIFIALLTAAPGGGTRIRDEDVLKTIIFIIAFIIVGMVVYFISKRMLRKNPISQSPQLLQEDYDRPIKIRCGLLTIILQGFAGVGLLYGGILVLTPYRSGSFPLLVFPLFGIYLLFRSIKRYIESITLDKENITLSKVFSSEIIPINNISSITLYASGEMRGVNIYITFRTKDNRSYKWFCDSFESADRITGFVRHWLPGVFIEETAGFQSKRGWDNSLNKPIKLFDSFNKKKKE